MDVHILALSRAIDTGDRAAICDPPAHELRPSLVLPCIHGIAASNKSCPASTGLGHDQCQLNHICIAHLASYRVSKHRQGLRGL